MHIFIHIKSDCALKLNDIIKVLAISDKDFAERFPMLI